MDNLQTDTFLFLGLITMSEMLIIQIYNGNIDYAIAEKLKNVKRYFNICRAKKKHYSSQKTKSLIYSDIKNQPEDHERITYALKLSKVSSV